MIDKTTKKLTDVLKSTKVDQLESYFHENEEFLAEDIRPFSKYMRLMFRQKGVKQQDVFYKADIPLGYGYKLISEEKKTKQRDLILRLCLASEFELIETQRALKLYGFSELYPKIQRDAILISLIHHCIFDMDRVNQTLIQYGFDALYGCKNEE